MVAYNTKDYIMPSLPLFRCKPSHKIMKQQSNALLNIDYSSGFARIS